MPFGQGEYFGFELFLKPRISAISCLFFVIVMICLVGSLIRSPRFVSVGLDFLAGSLICSYHPLHYFQEATSQNL